MRTERYLLSPGVSQLWFNSSFCPAIISCRPQADQQVLSFDKHQGQKYCYNTDTKRMCDKHLWIGSKRIICKRNTKRKQQIPEQGGKENELLAERAIELLSGRFFISEKATNQTGVKTEEKIIHNRTGNTMKHAGR